MKFNDFIRLMLTAWPDAEIQEDHRTGELVIWTGRKLEGNTVVKMTYDYE